MEMNFSYEARCPRCNEFLFSVPDVNDIKGMSWYCPRWTSDGNRCGGEFIGWDEYDKLFKKYCKDYDNED
jgi:hypothetical protein